MQYRRPLQQLKQRQFPYTLLTTSGTSEEFHSLPTYIARYTPRVVLPAMLHEAVFDNRSMFMTAKRDWKEEEDKHLEIKPSLIHGDRICLHTGTSYAPCSGLFPTDRIRGFTKNGKYLNNHLL